MQQNSDTKPYLDELPLHVAHGTAHVVAVCPKLPLHLPQMSYGSLAVQGENHKHSPLNAVKPHNHVLKSMQGDASCGSHCLDVYRRDHICVAQDAEAHSISSALQRALSARGRTSFQSITTYTSSMSGFSRSFKT